MFCTEKFSDKLKQIRLAKLYRLCNTLHHEGLEVTWLYYAFLSQWTMNAKLQILSKRQTKYEKNYQIGWKKSQL